MPKQQVIFSGDVIYLDRLLSVMSFSSSKNWVSVFEKLASFSPKYIVPGHGSPCSLDKAKKDTRDYLEYLRETVAAFISQGGGAYEISRVNQDRFSYLDNYETLAGRNALKVYTELEWE